MNLLSDQGGCNWVLTFSGINPHTTQKIDNQSDVRELTATNLYLTL